MSADVTADAWIAVLRQAHDQLAEVVRGLDADGLARQSACADWDVAQVLGHLGSGAEIGAATLDAALAGRDGPGRDFNQPVWDRWNGLDNQAKAAGFLEHAGDLVAATRPSTPPPAPTCASRSRSSRSRSTWPPWCASG